MEINSALQKIHFVWQMVSIFGRLDCTKVLDTHPTILTTANVLPKFITDLEIANVTLSHLFHIALNFWF